MATGGSARTVWIGLGLAAGAAALLVLPVGDPTGGRPPAPPPPPAAPSVSSALVVRPAWPGPEPRFGGFEGAELTRLPADR